MLNDLYFKTTCNIRPHFLGPMGGLKICYVILPCTYIAPKSDILFRGALQRIILYWVAEGDRYGGTDVPF